MLSLSGPTGCTVGRGSHESTGSAPRRQVSITWSRGNSRSQPWKNSTMLGSFCAAAAKIWKSFQSYGACGVETP